jgi:hypothetical protein
MMLGNLWERQGSESAVHTRIRILGPDESVVAAFEPPPASYGHNARMRQNVALGGFPFSQAGKYEVIVEQKRADEWLIAARIPLQVVQSSAEEIQAVQKQRAAVVSTT